MAAEEKTDKKTESADKSASSAKKGGGKLSLILGVVQLLVTLGIGAVVFIQFQKSKNKESVSDISLQDQAAKEDKDNSGKSSGGLFGKKAPTVVSLEQFTVNLSTSPGTPPRFARVIVALEIPSDDTATELNQKMPQVRNSIIDLFNSKRPADLQSGEGRNYLKDEIKNALNSFLVSGKVKNVFFSNFTVGS